MTLIFASHPTDSSHFIITDCLITNRTLAGEPLNIELASGRDEEAQYIGVTELCKKLYILHPHLAVAWAGTKIEAKHFLRDIQCFITPETKINKNILNKIGLVFKHNDYQDLCVIVSAYFQEEDKVKTVRNGCKEKVFSRIGRTFYAGSGSSYLEKLEKSLAEPELFEIENHRLTDNEITECRAITLAANIFMDECLSYDNLNHYFGGMFDFCYFDHDMLSFVYVDDIFIHFWPIKYSPTPPYTFYYGSITENETTDKAIFSVYKNKIKNNCLMIYRYENIKITKHGHLLQKKEYKVENLIPSLFPVKKMKNKKYSINKYYVFDRSGMYKQYIYLDICEEKWIKFNFQGNNQYKAVITKRAFEQSKLIVKNFMENKFNH